MEILNQGYAINIQSRDLSRYLESGEVIDFSDYKIKDLNYKNTKNVLMYK